LDKNDIDPKKNGIELNISPHDKHRDKMFFEMQRLKKMIPEVIVKGILKISRAVIKEKDEEEWK